MEPHKDPLLTTAEVAAELSISVRKVYDLIRSGELPHVNMGYKTKRIHRSALDAYINAREAHGCN